MSRENVEVVRRSIEDWRRGDLDSALSYYDEDAVFKEHSGSYRGRKGILRAVAQWAGAFSDYWLETERLLAAGDHHVVWLFRDGGKGKTSGLPVESRRATVFTVLDGKIIWARVYPNYREALDAVGLRE